MNERISDERQLTLYSLNYEETSVCGDIRNFSTILLVSKAVVNDITAFGAIRMTVFPYNQQGGSAFARELRLAGVSFTETSAAQRQKISAILQNLLVGKTITVITYGFEGLLDNRIQSGLIELKDLSINYSLLKNGLGRFLKPQGYELDPWTACHFQRAEVEAREGRRGIWKLQ